MIVVRVKLLGRAHDESVNYFVKQVKLHEGKEDEVLLFTLPRIFNGSATSLPWSDGPTSLCQTGQKVLSEKFRCIVFNISYPR